MSKPEDVTDEAWETATAILGHPGVLVSASCYQRIAEQSARAIMAAEEGAAAKIERLQRERDYAVVWANRSVAQVKEGIDALEARNKELLQALEALRLQALQSNVNSAANEWGREALAMANAAIEASSTPA